MIDNSLDTLAGGLEAIASQMRSDEDWAKMFNLLSRIDENRDRLAALEKENATLRLQNAQLRNRVLALESEKVGRRSYLRVQMPQLPVDPSGYADRMAQIYGSLPG